MEIKFRVWDKRNKEMHQLITWHDPRYLDSVEYTVGQSSTDIRSLRQDKNCVIMMFTGIRDKNNKEIYEGDIIKTRLRTGYVVYNLGRFLVNDFNTLLNHCIAWDIEILGNIYENEDLKKKYVK